LDARVSELEIIYDALSILRDKEQEAMKLLRTGRTFALKGWIPAADAQKPLLTN
jgi:vacuolar-type H+-ATPase subunit I/STV1